MREADAALKVSLYKIKKEQLYLAGGYNSFEAFQKEGKQKYYWQIKAMIPNEHFKEIWDACSAMWDHAVETALKWAEEDKDRSL